jgi:hypothetical protein
MHIADGHNSLYIFGVIPAKAGIQFDRKMDARLRISGMTGEKSVNAIMSQ